MKRHMRLSTSDRIFAVAVNTILMALVLIVLFPLLHIVASSFSAPAAVVAGRVTIWPVDFSLRGYEAVFQYKSIGVGYRNTILYTVLGTATNILMTIFAAYPLAKRNLPLRNPIMMLFTFTMFFSGGMIPNYLLLRDLKLLNKIPAMIIPGAISAYNMIIMRTFFQETIPQELGEAAEIDGCNEFLFLARIVLRLSTAAIAVVALYYAVGHWNSYFSAFLYLSDPKLKPLQIVLRDILILNQINQEQLLMADEYIAQQGMAELLKYAIIIVSSLPVLALYPLVQRYFVKGVMIGSIKG